MTLSGKARSERATDFTQLAPDLDEKMNNSQPDFQHRDVEEMETDGGKSKVGIPPIILFFP